MWDDFVEKAADAILKRRNARRSLAYKRALLDKGHPNVWAQQMLKDLEQFCYAKKTTFHENERAHVLAEGRREVWLRIQHFLNISEAELAQYVEIDDEY